MDILESFRRFAQYNEWMNDMLYETCSRLSQDELKLDMQVFFGSIHGTLNHILLADRVWLGRLAGYPFKVDSLRQELYPEFHLLCQARKHTDHDIKRMVAELSPADIDKPVTYWSISTNRRASATRGQILLHLFNHQTHHRGQITSMLSQLGHNYGVTDLIALPETTLAA